MATYTNATGELKLKAEDIVNFSYTGSVKEITLQPGTYKFECWGAQGGPNTTYGGKGGYAYGTIDLEEKTKFFVVVGGTTSSNTGGYNGGGTGVVSNQYGGGGASDIRLKTNSLYSRIIVAGAGGGWCSISTSYTGGVGGGYTGGNGIGNDIGYGGTQKAGGVTGSNSNHYGRISNGSFGYGGRANWSSEAIGQGGAGWYGGGAGCGYGNNGSGGGGSSFIWSSAWKSSTANVASNAAFNLTDAYLLTNIGTSSGTRSGHGYIRITCLALKRTALILDGTLIKTYLDGKWQIL